MNTLLQYRAQNLQCFYASVQQPIRYQMEYTVFYYITQVKKLSSSKEIRHKVSQKVQCTLMDSLLDGHGELGQSF